MPHELIFRKRERLCSRTAINVLFAQGKTMIAYPLRSVHHFTDAGEVPARFMVTVPKKHIRHAVDRVKLRRRIREAYRLNRHLLLPVLQERELHVDIAMLYLDKEKQSYATIEQCVRRLLIKIADKAAETSK